MSATAAANANANATVEQPPPPPRPTTPVNYIVDQPPSARSTTTNRALELSPSARTIIVTRSPQPINANNDQPQPPSARSVRHSGLTKVVPMVPPSVPITLRPTSSGVIPPVEPPMDIRRDRRYAAASVFLCSHISFFEK